MTIPRMKEQAVKALAWIRDKAVVLALALLAMSLLSPHVGQAQFVNPCCVTAAIGLSSINSSLVSNIGGGLTKILTVEQNMQQFQQSTIYPSSAITQALQLVGSLRGLYTQVKGVYRLLPHFSSATLGNTRALESILLSGSAGQIGNTNTAYLNVYGSLPPATNAPASARNVIDMSDAVAQDAMERAIAIDNIADQELQAADQINTSINNAAPGTAPIIEAQADAWLVRANAYTQSAVSDLMRERAAALANNGALLKDGANYTSVTTQGLTTVRSLGKMMLQNVQLCIGKRYESPDAARRGGHGFFSIILDEFSPFGYRNFSRILNTARGAETGFLFSLQSLPQLAEVGKGFAEDISSAPNTTISARTRDETTAQYFIKASAEHTVTKRSVMKERGLFGLGKYQETGRATESEDRETRSQDESIKNLPKGMVEILMSDDTEGTRHGKLMVRPPDDVTIPAFTPTLFPRLIHSIADSKGANLRFKQESRKDEFHVPNRPRFQTGGFTK